MKIRFAPAISSILRGRRGCKSPFVVQQNRDQRLVTSSPTTNRRFAGFEPKSNYLASVGLLLLALVVKAPTAAAQDTAFTYQGRVTDNGTNFTGPGLFKFALVTSTNGQGATATAVMNGVAPNEFVDICTVVNGGSGYATAPAVSFSGGGGSGATAQANLSGGVVTSITVLTPGSG